MIVTHASGSYPVTFQPLEEIIQTFEGLIVTDRNVAGHWGHTFGDRHHIVLPAGEETKCLDSFGKLLREFAHEGIKRNGQILAVGGGVIGDLAGFAAASYMRGIQFIQIPTTVMAMVDSSVGGKVGIDLPEGKNLVGAFWAPAAVAMPMETLSTLPERQFRNGIAEVWKYGFILETSLLDVLQERPLQKGSADLESVIRRCVALKAGIVQEDEHDRSGSRAILNFGHTVGHALEKVTGYSGLLHGEAIAIGMVVEAQIGEAIGFTKPGTAQAIKSLLERDGLPVSFPNLGAPSVLAAMHLDKKAEGNGLAFSLVSELGRCKLVSGLAEGDVAAVLRTL